MDKIQRIILLGKLNDKLKAYDWERLGLLKLQPLKKEVQTEIDNIIIAERKEKSKI